jgi:hypothetical protein
VWLKDRLYTEIRYQHAEEIGIAWASFDSPFWTPISFAVDFPIENMNLIDNSNLLIQIHAEKTVVVKKETKTEERYYKIPCR